MSAHRNSLAHIYFASGILDEVHQTLLIITPLGGSEIAAASGGDGNFLPHPSIDDGEIWTFYENRPQNRGVLLEIDSEYLETLLAPGVNVCGPLPFDARDIAGAGIGAYGIACKSAHTSNQTSGGEYSLRCEEQSV